MLEEHQIQVEKAIIYYVRDFANKEENLAEHAKTVREYARENKERMDNYIKNFKDIYETTAMFLKDRGFLEITIVKGLSQDEQDHWGVKDLYLRKRCKEEKIVAHQLKTTRLRDKVGKIIRKLGKRIFPTLSQLIDQSEKTGSANADEEEGSVVDEALENDSEHGEGTGQDEETEEDEDEIGVRERSDCSVREEERKRKREVEDEIEGYKVVIEKKDQLFNDIVKEKEEWIKQKTGITNKLKSCMKDNEKLVEVNEKLVEVKEKIVEENGKLVEDNGKLVEEKKVKDQIIQKRDMELYQRDKEIYNLKEKLLENNNNMMEIGH